MNEVIDIANWAASHTDSILFAATSAISAASTIAAITPTPKDDNAIKYIRKIIDLIAMNIGHAKTKKAE